MCKRMWLDAFLHTHTHFINEGAINTGLYAAVLQASIQSCSDAFLLEQAI